MGSLEWKWLDWFCLCGSFEYFRGRFFVEFLSIILSPFVLLVSVGDSLMGVEEVSTAGEVMEDFVITGLFRFLCVLLYLGDLSGKYTGAR